MGTFSRFVHVFKKEKADTPEDIPLTGLRPWMQLRSQEVIRTSNIQENTQQYLSSMRGKSQLLNFRIDEWTQKVRKLPNAEEIFPLFRETRNFLDLLRFEGEVTLEKVLTINEKAAEKLLALSQKIESSSFAADYDFLFEGGQTESLNPLLKWLLDLDALRKTFDQNIAESGYAALSSIMAELDLAEQITGQGKALQKEFEAKKNRLASTMEKKQEKEKSLQDLRSDAKSSDIESIKKRREVLLRDIDDNEMNIISFFSKMKPLLRQHKNMEGDTDLIRSYIDDPLTALMKDEHLAIRHTLQHLKALLKQDKISLRQEEFIAILPLLERSDLEQYQMKHKQLNDELKKVRSILQQHDFNLKVDDASYRVEHYAVLTQKLNQEINSMRSQIENLNNSLFKLKDSIQQKVESSLKKKINLLL
ncbi:MAG: hypothetical protein AABX05_03235 [Nanoarchaeota archaeon]